MHCIYEHSYDQALIRTFPPVISLVGDDLLMHACMCMYVCVQAGRGEVLVKNLRSGQQRAVAFSACEEAVREAIRSGLEE